MTCVSCDQVNADGQKFCSECGTALMSQGREQPGRTFELLRATP